MANLGGTNKCGRVLALAEGEFLCVESLRECHGLRTSLGHAIVYNSF